jgi:TorA maturation chaperone TorD
MNKIEESVVAGERWRTYKFLSGLCLKPPSGSLISILKDGSILSVFKDYKDSKGYFELAGFIDEIPEITNIENELSAEHTTLFVLPSAFLPHEAVYLDKEKRLGGRVTISVKQFYEKAGADILKDCTEMPDHIGIELEFMGFLCKLEKELWEKVDLMALQKCIEFQKAFLEEHLLKWVFQCCGKIIERATYGFYKAIANLIMEFVRSEKEYLTELHAKTTISL